MSEIRDDYDPSMDAKSGRDRRRKIMIRHNRAAVAGVHLPSVQEILMGSPWHGDDVMSDCKVFAERTLPRVKTDNVKGRDVAAALSALTTDPTMSDFLAAAAAFQRAQVRVDDGLEFGTPADELRYQGPDAASAGMRMSLYAAAMGSRESCVTIASHAAGLAMQTLPVDVTSKLSEAALGWLSASRSAGEVRRYAGRGMSRWDDHRLQADRDGDTLIKEILRYHELLAEDNGIKKAEEKPTIKALAAARGRMSDIADRSETATFPEEHREEAESEKKSEIIVIKEIGSPLTGEGKKIAEAYKPVVGLRLPLTPLPDLDVVRATLTTEFPHAGVVIDAVLRDLGGREFVRMKPTILVGKPGCGKTTFATRLLTLLGVHHQLYPCGGVADSSLAGTARHWSTGNTALPVAVAVRYRTASPGIVLDEVARSGTSRHNGNMCDALLSMIEPVSACRYLDPYLESEINLSGVCWLGTANDLESVPAPLRDRFRIIAFPSPSVEHLPALANRILKSLIADQGLSSDWALPLDGVELEALAETWPSGGSLRGLRKLVEGVLAARDRHTASA